MYIIKCTIYSKKIKRFFCTLMNFFNNNKKRTTENLKMIAGLKTRKHVRIQRISAPDKT